MKEFTEEKLVSLAHEVVLAHVSPAEIKDFVDEKTSIAQSARIKLHLETCEICDRAMYSALGSGIDQNPEPVDQARAASILKLVSPFLAEKRTAHEAATAKLRDKARVVLGAVLSAVNLQILAIYDAWREPDYLLSASTAPTSESALSNGGVGIVINRNNENGAYRCEIKPESQGRVNVLFSMKQEPMLLEIVRESQLALRMGSIVQNSSLTPTNGRLEARWSFTSSEWEPGQRPEFYMSEASRK